MTEYIEKQFQKTTFQDVRDNLELTVLVSMFIVSIFAVSPSV